MGGMSYLKSRGKVSWGTVLGKLSEGEVNRGELFWGEVSYLKSRWKVSWGNCIGGKCPRETVSRGKLSVPKKLSCLWVVEYGCMFSGNHELLQ